MNIMEIEKEHNQIGNNEIIEIMKIILLSPLMINLLLSAPCSLTIEPTDIRAFHFLCSVALCTLKAWPLPISHCQNSIEIDQLILYQ